MRGLHDASRPVPACGQGRHPGGVLWLTGLSGAGKSTLAALLHQGLETRGLRSYVLDGDVLRAGLNRDLGFAEADRMENVRRVGEVAALFADAGFIVIAALISPYASSRQRAREAARTRFHEVYVKAGIETCAARDPKGLYRRARSGQLAQFTGVSAPYEVPVQPELTIDTETDALPLCVERLLGYTIERLGR
jgi:adenylyl-sulfate kinase